ncbi:unnamed protein product [Moneuplotes crassus]|uniref:LITAF domain-containing protein n=1 Tax=Euplotes crassus TaxID=5936 RepID=A0AAD1Y1L6_EUPCR|nr:unnamed protein product [Moneuplotes crassus]
MLTRGIYDTEQVNSKVNTDKRESFSINDENTLENQLNTDRKSKAHHKRNKSSKIAPSEMAKDPTLENALAAKNFELVENSSIPVELTCHFCKKDVVTEVKTRLSKRQKCYCVCLGFLLMPCFSWIPCVISSCRDHQHFCPKCTRYLARS